MDMTHSSSYPNQAMRRGPLLALLFSPVPFAILLACAGPTGPTGAGDDASTDGTGSDANANSCANGVRDGAETDVDCGGSCALCTDGKKCSAPADCASGVCQGGTCQVPTCSDSVQNGLEVGVDCGGSGPPKYHGFGCGKGTHASQACSSFPNDAGAPIDGGSGEGGVPKFQVAISWNAAGGNAYVDYVLVYGSSPNVVFNSQGIYGGSPNNVCTSGPYTETFDLPLGDKYTYKVWHAYCVKVNACSGCGSDTVVATGGPFGIAEDPCP